jgi:hypothetical protein
MNAAEIVKPGATKAEGFRPAGECLGNLRHAEHFRCLHTRIDDCASMSLFATAEMEKRDDGANPQLAFAVYHLGKMILDLKRHYHAAYKGEIEP